VERNFEVAVTCVKCHKNKSLSVCKENFELWIRFGGLLQDVMPYLDADERELLISSTCSSCWEKMFPEEDTFLPMDVEADVTTNEAGVPEIKIKAPDKQVAIFLNDLLVYGDKNKNPKRFANTAFNYHDVVSSCKWLRGDDKILAEKFLLEHSTLLEQHLKHQGKTFINQLLETWEGPVPPSKGM
jgi:hypothetical protein